MIEPVSDLRLQIFGNIAESARRFSEELSGDLIIREARDRWLMLKSPATARLSRRLSHQTQRPDWLAGAPGFEPGNGGIKIRCLTTWLRPNLPQSAVLGAAIQCPGWGAGLKRPRSPAKETRGRSVAQPGSAPRSGRGGRRFKSCHSDQFPRGSPFRHVEMAVGHRYRADHHNLARDLPEQLRAASGWWRGLREYGQRADDGSSCQCKRNFHRLVGFPSS
jgi:hypothetical protein